MARTAAAVAVVAMAGSCSDSFIYDYEGDCDPDYRVRFHYDYNLKNADAFASEVDHVTLNVIDSEGRIVHTHTESGDALKAAGYEIVLDDIIKPGKYRLQAWCGMGAHPDSKSFAIHPSGTLEGLRCTLLSDEAASRADDIEGAEGTHVRRELKNLYHGLTEELDFPDDEGVHTFDVNLMKNTNSVKVVLQHLSGEPIDYRDFDFTITSANARMDHDNSIIGAAPVVYHAWDVRGGQADISSGGTAQPGVLTTAVAEFTIARLMEDEDVRLKVTRASDGMELFSVPMIDLALLIKSANLRSMPDQEFLDRQDDYSFVFFLDANYRWTQVQINILSWTVVYNNTEI